MTGVLPHLSTRRALSLLGVLLVSLAVACGAAAAPKAVSVNPQLDRSEDALNPILATTVLRTGAQRVSFLLTTPKALVKAPQATVTSKFLEGDGATGETRQAIFHLWPYGIRGAYSTELTFERPGRWQLDISVDDAQFSGATQLVVDVAETSEVPDIGMVPPKSRTKTLSSAGGFEALTTDFTPDPDLYQVTVAEAISSGRPAVIVFSTPAFCTSPTCGPQVDTLSELKERHQGEANFVHVEIYDNPAEIQGDLSKAEVTQAVHDWGFTRIPGWFNESWSFVLDRQGRIEQRFEGFVTLEELEESLQEALARS